ncbi:MAG TPA: CBS domain-containing protein [Longimicrobiales bacterium]|nr:CBS domain-containing protein [Longimicrobiales bacterium]
MTGDGESVGEAAQRVDGCLPQNSAEDVLDVMDELHLNFMPLVEDFASGRVLGIVARDELARILEWNGGSGRAGDAELIELPTIRADTPLIDIADAAKQHHAWLVVDLRGRVHGIYESSDLAGHEEPWQE